MELKNKFLPHIISVSVFFLITFIFCQPAFNGMRVKTHDSTQFQGMAKTVNEYREETAGEEPLWLDNMFGGMPTYMVSQKFPSNYVKKLDYLLSFGLPMPAAYFIKLMLGFYLLMLCIRVRWDAAIACSIAFAFSSYYIVLIQAGHNTKLNAVTYMAPILAGILLTLRGRWFWGGVVTALFLALEISARHPQITYYLGLSVVILIIGYAIKYIKEKKIKELAISGGVLLAALGLAIGVNNTTLRVSSDYVKDSQRVASPMLEKAQSTKKEKPKLNAEGLTKKQAYLTNWSYGIKETFTLLVPNFRGGGSAQVYDNSSTYKFVKKNAKRFNPNLKTRKEKEAFAEQVSSSYMYWGEQPGVNGATYIGASVFFLFVFALFAAHSKLRWWALSTVVLMIFIAWGKNFLPFFKLLFGVLPGYDKFRAMTMAFSIAEMVIPALVAVFFVEYFKGKISNERLTKALYYSLGIVGGLLVIFLVSAGNMDFLKSTEDMAQLGQMGKKLVADRASLFNSDILRSLGFVLATAAVIFAVLKQKLPAKYMAIIIGVIFLVDLWGVDARYLNASKYVERENIEKPFPSKPVNDEINKDKGYYRVANLSSGVSGAINDASTAYHHRDVGGYSSAKLRVYQDLIDYGVVPELKMLNQYMKQLAGGKRLPNELSERTQILNMMNMKYVISSNPNIPIENSNAFGPAWFVDSIVYGEKPKDQMNLLIKSNLIKTAIVPTSDKELIKQNYQSVGNNIELVSHDLNKIVYKVNVESEKAFMVFSEVYYPKGWTLRSGELELPIYKTNYALRGAEIPQGEHELVMSFEPQLFHSAERISLVCSLLVIGLFIVGAILELKKALKSSPETIDA